MNVLFYQDTLGVSGAERYIADLAARMRERGHGVSLACPSRSWMEQQALHKGFAYVDFASEDGTDNHHHWAIADHLAQHEIDVILCGIPGARPEVPRLDAAVRSAGRGRIVLRVGVTPGSERAFSPDRLGIDYDTVGGIIAVSEDVRDHLLRFYPRLDRSRVHVIYNGVDIQTYAPDSHSVAEAQNVRREIGVPDGHTVVASIGRLDPVKNLPHLIDAADTVVKLCPKTTFVIAGQGAQRDPLERLVAERGLSESVLFVGEIEDVPRLLSAVDIVCHPSLSEGVPNTLLEAMAAGKAVVASDVGGIKELVTHNESGWLFPAGNGKALTESLLSLLQNGAEIDRLSEAARSHVEKHFDRDANVDEVTALLSRCARHPAPLPAGRKQMYVPDDSFIAQPPMVA